MALIKFITLGCSKNTVDSEVIIGNLNKYGHQVLDSFSHKNPEIIIINTCGFIGDAKQESIQVILESEFLKKKHRIEKLYVMGCLAQRYKEELQKEFPTVDGWYGVHQMEELLADLTEQAPLRWQERVLTTPPHYAYLKIAEGCDRACSFCAIPLIRGKHISRPAEELVEEARQLVKNGVKEIILISQDVTYYGVDLYGKKTLASLMHAISEIDGLQWLRLNYLYPHQFPYDVLEVMRENPKVCRYIDIPLQHISTRILQSMKRACSKEDTYQLLDLMRKKVPGVALRTTLIVGYPGETAEEYEELKTFVREQKFERLGVFQYSAEEGTSAYALADDVPEEVKKERMEEIMAIQQEISMQKNQDKTGQNFRILCDRIEGEYMVGRTEFDSPEVDNEVLVLDDEDLLAVGDFFEVHVTEADAFDLFASPLPTP